MTPLNMLCPFMVYGQGAVQRRQSAPTGGPVTSVVFRDIIKGLPGIWTGLGAHSLSCRGYVLRDKATGV